MGGVVLTKREGRNYDMSNDFVNQSQAVKRYFPELTRSSLRALTALGLLPGKKLAGWFVYEERHLIELRERLDRGLEELRSQVVEVV